MTVTVDTGHRSIGQLFLAQVAKNPSGRAFAGPSPITTAAPGTIGTTTLTWQETADQVSALAAGLVELGVQPGDRIGIASGTRVEWILADLAIMCAGGATTTIYPTTEAGDAAFILADSGSSILFAEDAAQLAKFRAKAADLPDLRAIVVFDGTDIDREASGPEVLTLAELHERGSERLAGEPSLIEQRVAGIGPDDLATLIYTSGTTGRPKGVRLVHANWIWESNAQAKLGIIEDNDLQYLWLPMAHSFGKVLLCAQLTLGFESYVDGRVDKIIETLPVVKPTTMAGVPRIYEKVYNRVRTMAQDKGGATWKIFNWALGVGREVVALREQGKEPSGLLAVKYAVATKLVFSKLQERFGGRMRGMISGAAPLSREVAEFFHAAGVPIYEGYGLTETTAGAFVNLPEKFKLGTVGLPLGDLEVKIAEDGEILLRGGNVMRGYHHLPEETEKVLSDDGWFHTGDIGELDDGFLRITDRKKDLVKTSGGKYIAPSYIEGLFKTIVPQVSQVIVHTRNYCTMLITVDPDEIKTWAQGAGLESLSVPELAGHPQLRAHVQAGIDQLNGQLNRWETIKGFVILPHDLSVDNGEITPSLKVRRKFVEEKYSKELDALYAGSSAD
ncbi:AMP-dependent synthetase/ligase [Cryptosporangium aurantiacum]|uniref:Acyl-CoA synthetase n=1 Tax=Cryptosporangium aurantiacum TaxID=134849 RepID=A0A1M7QN77_9ACTN|nr:long-chain fatty acid--CoA ligase [Cryptosporangium aurantiacum]SHN32942.1 long-chain acyl-CoA synthetase [Cryptosporangium aurantiacum]